MQTSSRSLGFVLLLIVAAWSAITADAQEPPEPTEFDEPDINAPYRQRAREAVAKKDIAAAERLLLEMPDVNLIEAVEAGDTLLVELVALGDAERLGQREYCSLYKQAALRGDLLTIRAMLRSGNPMSIDEDGLRWAASNCKLPVVRAFVSGGANLNLLESYSSGTPLHQAVALGRHDVAELLLESGANPNLATKFGWTPLHAVSQSGRIDIAQLLLDHGADPLARKVTGTTPVHEAIEYHQFALARWLLEHGGEFDAHVAAGLGDLAAVRRLYPDPLKLDLNMPGGPSPVFMAAKANQLEVVKHFIEAGVDVNLTDDNKITLLTLAAGEDSPEVVAYLLAKQANPYLVAEDLVVDRFQSPLHSAAAGGRLKAIGLVLDAGMQVDQLSKWKKTPLLVAIEHGQRDVVKLLLSRGAKCEGIAKGVSPLRISIFNYEPEICRILLEAGASPDQPPHELQQAMVPHLFSAMNTSQGNIFEMLLEYGAQVQPVPGQARSDSLDDVDLKLLRRLVELGLDVNAVNEQGNSMLLQSIRNGRADLARLLLAAGAKIGVDRENNLAIYAGKLGDVFVLQELQKQGLTLFEGKRGGPSVSGIRSPLEAAVQYDRKDMVRYLIAQGMNPRIVMDHGAHTSLLPLGVEKNAKLAVMELLAAGAAKPPYPPSSVTNKPANPVPIALFDCIRNGRPGMFRVLLRQEGWRDDPAAAELWKMAAEGNHKCLQILIEQLPEAKAHLEEMMWLAAKKGNLSGVEVLLKAGAPATLQDEEGRTLLHFVAGVVYTYSSTPPMQLSTLQLLVEHGARLEARDRHGWTTAHMATQRGNIDLARKLVKAGNPLDAHLAAALGDVAYLKQRFALHGKEFIERDEPAKDSIVTPVVWRTIRPISDTGKMLNGKGLLAWAALSGSVETIEYLVSLDLLDINGNERMAPLLIALGRADLPVVEAFLKAGANPNGNDYAPKSVIIALALGNADALKLLLDHQANPDQTDKDGMMALQIAVKSKKLELVQPLVEAGAKLDETFQGTTALELALRSKEEKSREIGAYLLEVGADPKAGRGEALYWEVLYGEPAQVEQFLKAGLNPNQQTADGSLALKAAVYRYRSRDARDPVALEMIRLLLAYNADPEVPDKHLQTAIGYAEQQQCPELLPLLRGGIKPR